MCAQQFLFAERLLVGSTLREEKNQYLLIENGVIQAILSQDAISEEMRRLPIHALPPGTTAMPGMIDCHTHLALDARIPGHLGMMEDAECIQTLRALVSIKDDLEQGITTLRSLGDRYYIDVILRDRINNGQLFGPRLQVAGIGMKGLHGHGYVGQGFSGVEDFRRMSRQNLYRGTDWLKIFVTGGAPPTDGSYVPFYISREEIRTVVQEAKAIGKRSCAHCIGGEGLKFCVEEGIDVLEHAYWATEADAELLMKQGTWVCLTPGVFLDEGREQFCPTGHVEKVRKTRDEVAKRLSRLIKHGVKYAIGSDAYHGLLYKDVQYVHSLGASKLEALQGVTVHAAELLGLKDTIGVIKPGAAADIITVDGNPLEDLSALSRVGFVMKGGVVIKN